MRLLCKPITILLISIIEASLHDFHVRCRSFTWEGIANLAEGALSYIRTKKLDKLSLYIQSARRHDLLEDKDGIYDDLERLSRVRNRIHIQNEKKDLEPDEYNVFTQQRKILAEKTLERVLKTLADKYPRSKDATGWVKDFELPWNEHFR